MDESILNENCIRNTGDILGTILVEPPKLDAYGNPIPDIRYKPDLGKIE